MAPAVVPGAYQAMAAGAIIPTKIDFGHVFSRTWAIFTRKWGAGLLAMLLMGVVLVVGVGVIVAVIVGLSAGGEQMLPLAILLGLVLGVGVGLAAIWLGIGLTIFFLKLCRGEEPDFGVIFSGGPYFIPVLLATILYQLMNLGMFFVVWIPMIVLAALVGAQGDSDVAALLIQLGTNLAQVATIVIVLIFMPYQYLIIDKNLGVIDAFKVAAQLTKGNRLTLLLIFIVAGIAAAVVTLCTCYLGILAVMPYMMILYTVLYLAMSGQPTAYWTPPGMPLAGPPPNFSGQV